MQLARILQAAVTALGGNSREIHFGVGAVGDLFFVADAGYKEFAGVLTPHGCSHRRHSNTARAMQCDMDRAIRIAGPANHQNGREKSNYSPSTDG
jgi:hypothetical protein